ncbi:HalOD1 output domain-containing protein [Natronorubrum halophilum]|uniref:HalOD1 output domain-containing protein n=1 Tax=Natronorubrum halophilum TaxID=1702106 RepID=UPI000EF7444A|nr:HalOD1 output domain-containing protein [Natronorubrum halophilum]
MSNDTTTSNPPSASPFGEDSVGHDPTTGTFHARFDADPDAVVVTIVETVATITNRDPIDMTPLFETVDPEALTDLVVSNRAQPIEVSFSYEGCRVTVSSDGTVVVEKST